MNEEQTRSLRELIGPIIRYGLIALVVLAALAVLVRLLGWQPPSEFTIATGRQGGAYYAFAQRYKEEFAKQGVTLNIRETAGSLETLELLNAGEVDAGFVQNTVSADRADEGLRTLAAIYYEAIWVFYRTDLISPNSFDDLGGARIGIGEEGSATEVISLILLNLNGVTNENSTLVSQPTSEAAQALRDGELDAMIFTAGTASTLVTDLLREPNIDIVPFLRADAYTRRFKNITAVTLPEGVLDLPNNIPAEDKQLVAARATLVSGPSLHPDLARLLLIIATDVHSQGGILEDVDEFPAPTTVGIPMNADAQRFLENGPTGLEQHLPLWLASRLERFLFLLLPIALIVFPLFRGLPSLVAWFNNYRIKRRYQHLRSLEMNYEDYSPEQLQQAIEGLEAWQADLRKRVKVPTIMLDQLYGLRRHTDLTIAKLEAQQARKAKEAVAATGDTPAG